MDFRAMLESLQSNLGETLPSILGALAVLVIGWLVAVIVRAGTRKALGAVQLNDRVESSTGNRMDVAGGAAAVVYYIILVFTLVAFFNTLQLNQASSTLQGLVDQALAFVPNLVGAGALLLVAFILGSVVRAIVTKTLSRTRIDERVTAEAGIESTSKSIGNALFWIIMLMFLPAILGALELKGMLAPVQSMVDKFLNILPNIFAAAVIALVGWLLARVLGKLVTNLLAATGLDNLGARAGLAGALTLSRLLGLLVYVFILVPALIAALDTLGIEAISGPATAMLSSLMSAVPNILSAAIILAVSYLISRFVAQIVGTLLAGVGFDAVPAKVGLARLFNNDAPASRFVGRVIVFFIMLFAAVEASAMLGFEQVADIVNMLIQFGGDVLLGVVIIGVGFWLSGLAHRAIQGLEKGAALASVIRFAIVGIVLAMGLRAMGLADDIVNLAFGLTLGSVAVAFALSFGLGGRQSAGEEMARWMRQLRGTE